MNARKGGAYEDDDQTDLAVEVLLGEETFVAAHHTGRERVRHGAGVGQ